MIQLERMRKSGVGVSSCQPSASEVLVSNLETDSMGRQEAATSAEAVSNSWVKFSVRARVRQVCLPKRAERASMAAVRSASLVVSS